MGGRSSTLTRAFPPSLLRLPIHLTEVPTKRNVAVARATVDCMARPPLHPYLGLVPIHPALKVTDGSDSSTSAPACGSVGSSPPPVGGGGGGGGGGPANGGGGVPPRGGGGVPPLGGGGVPPLGGFGVELAPPLELSPPPPPPQEISIAASNKTPTRVM